MSLGIELSKTTLGSLLNQQQISKEDLLAKGLEKKWGWYQSIHSLAKGDVFKIDKATRTNLHKAMMWLEFEKDKSDLEERIIKKAYK